MVTRCVEDFIRTLSLYNPTDIVSLSIVEDEPVISVGDEIVLGKECECDSCEEIRKKLPDFGVEINV